MELWEIRCWNYYVYNMEETGIWRQGLAIRLLGKLVYVYSVHVYAMQWYQKAELLYFIRNPFLFNFKLVYQFKQPTASKNQKADWTIHCLDLETICVVKCNYISFLTFNTHDWIFFLFCWLFTLKLSKQFYALKLILHRN